tara:strand:+ start:54 stop:458 length:405 start_codon:yes stop_codon:yes gene_type:complete
MLKSKHHNILENLFDVTFGRGSLREGYAIRHKTQVCPTSGDTLLEIRFECPINFNPRLGLASQKKELDSDSIKALSEKVKNVKKEFKNASGVGLKLKILNEKPSEVQHISHNRELIRARYSRSILYSLSVTNGD